LGLFGPPFRWLIDIQRRFPDVFAKRQNGFVPTELCFVAATGMKHCLPAEMTRDQTSGSETGGI
jgi:hypothetical protein